MPRRQTRRPAQDLLDLLHGQESRRLLEHAVMLVAEDLNKRGSTRQINFILAGLGMSRSIAMLKKLIREEKEVHDLTAQIDDGGCLDRLLRLAYDYKMKEAHRLTHARRHILIRYLVKELGYGKLSQLLKTK